MRLNQLFTRMIEKDIVNRLLKCIGLHGVTDGRNFTKYDLIRLKSVEKFEDNLLDELSTYYLPCKARIYLNGMTEKKLITVIKQVLRLYDYAITVQERTLDGCKKTTIYRICPARPSLPSHIIPIKVSLQNITLSFEQPVLHTLLGESTGTTGVT
jgi:hypothetical protein